MITLRQSFYHRHKFKNTKNNQVSAPGSNTGNGYKLNLRSKGLFANMHLLFTAFVVLLRLVVNTSRQCSKRFAEADTFLTCVNLENPPVITKKI